jgi:hypothetical protein
MKRLTLVLLLLSAVVYAKEKEKVVFESVKNNPYTSTFNWTTPGRAGTASTDCTGSSTTYGNDTYSNTNGSANCETTYSAPTPPRTTTYNFQNVLVEGYLTRANGERWQVQMWCRKAFRDCRTLNEGEIFQAERDGNTIWIIGRDGLKDKAIRIKYTVMQAKKL